jgi:hypothetical protein
MALLRIDSLGEDSASLLRRISRHVGKLLLFVPSFVLALLKFLLCPEPFVQAR